MPRFRPVSGWVIALSAAAALLLGGAAVTQLHTTSASADQHAGTIVVKGSGDEPVPSADLKTDAATAAKTTGVDPDVMLKYMAVTEPWDNAVQQIRATAPTQFVSAYRTNPADDATHSPDPHVVLTGGSKELTDAVVRILETLPFDTTLTTGAAASETNLVKAMEAVSNAVRPILKADLYGTDVDPRTSAITVTVGPKASDSAVDQARSAAVSAAESVLGKDSGIDVKVIVSSQEELPVLDSWTAGGKDLDTTK